MAFYVTWGVAAYAAGIHVLPIEPKNSNLKGSFWENFQKTVKQAKLLLLRGPKHLVSKKVD